MNKFDYENYSSYCEAAGIPEEIAQSFQWDVDNHDHDPEQANAVVRVAKFSNPNVWKLAIKVAQTPADLHELFHLLGVGARFLPERRTLQRHEENSEIIAAIKHLQRLIRNDPIGKELTFWKVIKCLENADSNPKCNCRV